MFQSLLVRLFGFPATLHHGDTLVWDRWRWIRRRLRMTRNNERLLDVGCGSGAFTIGCALRGYSTLGLSWDERNQSVAQERALLCGATTAKFETWDVRRLDERRDWIGGFGVVLCCENIEHILDDFRLMKSMADCLEPGGRLLLTTPQLRRIPQSSMDYGPFPDTENGHHIRRGYNRAMLAELCAHSGLVVEEMTLISGPISQLAAWLLWRIGRISHPLVGWVAVLPLRPLPPLIDWLLTWAFDFPPFCIGLEAYKPRLGLCRAVNVRRAQRRRAE
jgi:2-polyprenyl-3-methyl-5-hydroxy-6-metoxy-1,4-benzoquinol methylase